MEDYSGWLCVIHHSASNLETTAEDIERWHVARNWSEIGYTWVIERDGTLVAGRSVRKNGAHAKGHNRKSFGICVVGNNTADGMHWTAAQKATLRATVVAVRHLFPGIRFAAHRELAATVCPGVDIEEYL